MLTFYGRARRNCPGPLGLWARRLACELGRPAPSAYVYPTPPSLSGPQPPTPTPTATPTPQAHLALALRRREAYLPSGAATLRLQCSWRGPHFTDWACTDAAQTARRAAARRKRRRAGLIAVGG